MSVTLGPCPGLADRCPRHRTSSSSTHGAPTGSTHGGLGSTSGMGIPPNHHPHPDNGLTARNSGPRSHWVPKGKARHSAGPASDLRAEVGAERRERQPAAAVIFTHVLPESS